LSLFVLHERRSRLNARRAAEPRWVIAAFPIHLNDAGLICARLQ
jgi:hypothetical protein